MDSTSYILPIEYDAKPYASNLDTIQSIINSADLIVGFNLKFDLAWLKRYGLKFDHCRIWDCQLVEFILSHQRSQFPDLGTAVSARGLGNKSTWIDDHYWSQGIDTPDIPWNELEAYNATDLEITDALYQWQIANIPQGLVPLVRLHNQDLLVLLEMEHQGIRVDFPRIREAGEVAGKELAEIDAAILRFVPETFRGFFNPNSGDHLSALLFGGTATGKRGTPHEVVVKSGPRAGDTVSRYKWETRSCVFERLCDPKDEWKLAKDGYWSTAEEVILQLSKPRDLIALLQKRSGLEKLRGTYYEGLRKTYEEKDWCENIIHGQFNQTRVVTGRLSSSSPNLQNFPPEMDQFLVSRFS